MLRFNAGVIFLRYYCPSRYAVIPTTARLVCQHKVDVYDLKKKCMDRLATFTQTSAVGFYSIVDHRRLQKRLVSTFGDLMIKNSFF